LLVKVLTTVCPKAFEVSVSRDALRKQEYTASLKCKNCIDGVSRFSKGIGALDRHVWGLGKPHCLMLS
jgi:hypothetical protein